ncbi:TetR family transcriptional regulator C-terminal domain-containing protein [Lentibacter sp. XHP0401]|uniref:TetR family transcriptional regulator C-terminal domain-containing protein n=1 Tax=Lentibacter sp. XHP0401 TaxID=2984334 RepID=UPI0021E8EA32|nr:TetR family transcriptional regulator C-terminal domain-containing protein [Lentibacter sp. XHP0401]MCV2892248.1 TetR family transcriptional regulator C-terminal domain-containing protein [Lentibacter sp. XHP0401]
MARSQTTRKPTRIQREKTREILEAALDVFSDNGFRGSTIDMIAERAGVSKPNILYYFDNKEAIHKTLLAALLKTWLAPLYALDESGDPIEEICEYVAQKLKMAQEFPRESKLFANEILQGAPHVLPELQGELKELTQQKADVVSNWIKAGKIAQVDPRHLFFSIWATTQHYADFDIQVRAVSGDGKDPFETAGPFLDNMYRALLTPAT